MTEERRYGAVYYLYTAVVAVAGLGLLAFVTGRTDAFGKGFPWEILAALSLLGFVSRFLSFRLMGLVTLTMDTALYLAAALILGAVPAAWAVFLTAALHVLWETLRREARPGGDRRPFPENVLAPLFQGGGAVLALLVPCLLLPVAATWEEAADARSAIPWTGPLLAVSFLAIQYALVLEKYHLLGSRWRAMLREVALPGLAAELLVVPLGVVMALMFHAEGPPRPGFWLLCVTHLVLNGVFRQMSVANQKAAATVEELRAFNALGRSLCGTLQAQELLPLLAEKTLDMIGRADWCLLYTWSDEAARFDTLRLFRRGGGTDPEVEARGVELAHRVTGDRLPFSTGPLPAGRPGELLEGEAAARLPGSWMGLPVAPRGQLLGVIVVFSYLPGRFEASDFALLEMVGLQAAIALQNARHYQLATVDALTRLSTRRHFDRRLRDEVARARRYGKRFSLMLVDLDAFKDVNDTLGHAAGDRVLRAVAGIIQQEIRSMDLPARRGGDEFAVLLPEVGPQAALVVAERIRRRLGESPVDVDGHRIRQTVSVGIASFPDHAERDDMQLLAVADGALYGAKMAGRNQVQIAADPGA
ncbi:MAG: sensor domain-containing diguanylate cyclase [Deltaproteobacteria bacterium]|nr:sensor domain-containing diguanylate cyclase [Deltaproteobacteria bacterium]